MTLLVLSFVFPFLGSYLMTRYLPQTSPKTFEEVWDECEKKEHQAYLNRLKWLEDNKDNPETWNYSKARLEKLFIK